MLKQYGWLKKEAPTQPKILDGDLTRHEHVAWCKRRALQILESGDLIGAYTSMVSDLKKHTETKDHIAITLGMGLLMSKKLETSKSMRNFIEGFN